jgi:isoquinoline 1-oxidoreductase beta subunit
MGIAGCSAYGSHIGLVATATIGDDQRIKVHRLVASVDCGRIVNSGLVTQQIAGGLVWAIAQATVPAPEWVAGMPRARSFAAMGLPRMGDTPDISVQLISNDHPPGGVSGLGTTVLAPAVANAIFAATGRRLRDLPFDLMAAP